MKTTTGGLGSSPVTLLALNIHTLSCVINQAFWRARREATGVCNRRFNGLRGGPFSSDISSSSYVERRAHTVRWMVVRQVLSQDVSLTTGVLVQDL